MSEERFEVIVIGGGLAGLSAAYRLSKAGRKVLVLEKAPYSGAKNVSGGRIYTYALDKLMGDEWKKDAPLEREINQEYLMMMNDEDAVIIDTTTNALGNQSYSVLREKFDKWLAKKVEEAGGLVIGGACVDGLIRKDGRVCGVTVGKEELECDLVIDAEGVNAIVAERAGVIDPIRLENIAVGIKSVIRLKESVINDRFNTRVLLSSVWVLQTRASLVVSSCTPTKTPFPSVWYRIPRLGKKVASICQMQWKH